MFFLNETKINYASLSYDLNNQKIGFSQLRVVSFNIQNSTNVLVSKTTLNTGDITKSKDVSYSSFDYGKQTLEIINSVSTNNDTILKSSLDLDSCASYTVFLFTRNNNTNNVEYILLSDIYPNGLSLFWQLIQIFVMTVGEIMFSISGLSFAYSQVLIRNIFSILCVIFKFNLKKFKAPATMKSILSATWLLTVALGSFKLNLNLFNNFLFFFKQGNLLVVIIAESRIVSNQCYEYILFAGLLFIATTIFIALSNKYKYAEDIETNKNKKNLSVYNLKNSNKNESKLSQKFEEFINNAVSNKGFLLKSSIMIKSKIISFT